MSNESESDVLKRFGLIAERDVASLLGITVESLRHRPLDRLPAFFKDGRRRLFKEEAVRDFLGLPPAPKAPTKLQDSAADQALTLAIDKATEGAAELAALLATIQSMMKARRRP